MRSVTLDRCAERNAAKLQTRARVDSVLELVELDEFAVRSLQPHVLPTKIPELRHFQG